MASEQNFEEPDADFGTEIDVSLSQKWNFSSPTTSTEKNNGCFDCNICLESALEPVVTLCGHLYCWPCIYEWLHVQSSSPDPEQQHQQNCPVCKANISHASLVPLYGRGISSDSKHKKPRLDLAIPRRPLPSGANATVTSTTTSMSHHQEFFSRAAAEQSGLRDMATASVFNPYGEMIYARIFGSSDPGLFAYPQTNSYPFVGNSSSPRMRRQEMNLDKSLNRVSIFLFCCFVLCLLSF